MTLGDDATGDVLDEAESASAFVYLSDVFKYISHYRRKGHQIGRKVGDMLEVMSLAAIYRDEGLRARLTLEPKLIGFSGAGHKVEFAIYDGKSAPGDASIENLMAFIECKKVGVEQTVSGSFKKRFGPSNIVPFNEPFDIGFNPRWATEGPSSFKVTFLAAEDAGYTVLVQSKGEEVHKSQLVGISRFMFGLTIDGLAFFIDNSSSLRAVEPSIRMCKILDIDGLAGNGLKCVVNDCLTGPQTPEKAKQASFVALDVRKGRFGHFDKRPDERECVSVLVLTEFSHWEPKSRNMVRACVDHTLVVDDALIVRAIDAYEKTYGDAFLNNMTKEFFMRTAEARKIALDLVNEFEGRIFTDMDTRASRAIRFKDGFVAVE